MHEAVRSHCMDYVLQNSDYYSQYITEDIETYVERKRYLHVHGNHLEIQALSEMYSRPIHIYSYGTGESKMNVLQDEVLSYSPLSLCFLPPFQSPSTSSRRSTSLTR